MTCVKMLSCYPSFACYVCIMAVLEKLKDRSTSQAHLNIFYIGSDKKIPHFYYFIIIIILFNLYLTGQAS